MFRADQLTGGDRQRRRADQLHALTIRQAATATDKDRRKTRGTAPKLPKCKRTCKKKRFRAYYIQ